MLPKDVTDAFDTAYANIKAFHEAQHSAPIEVETMPGVRCRRLTRPIGEGGGGRKGGDGTNKLGHWAHWSLVRGGWEGGIRTRGTSGSVQGKQLGGLMLQT